ncbi:hypothetical protein ACFX16_042639 [Malus domestica]
MWHMTLPLDPQSKFVLDKELLALEVICLANLLCRLVMLPAQIHRGSECQCSAAANKESHPPPAFGLSPDLELALEADRLQITPCMPVNCLQGK